MALSCPLVEKIIAQWAHLFWALVNLTWGGWGRIALPNLKSSPNLLGFQDEKAAEASVRRPSCTYLIYDMWWDCRVFGFAWKQPLATVCVPSPSTGGHLRLHAPSQELWKHIWCELYTKRQKVCTDPVPGVQSAGQKKKKWCCTRNGGFLLTR